MKNPTQFEERSHYVLTEIFGAQKANLVLDRLRDVEENDRQVILSNLMEDFAAHDTEVTTIAFEKTKEWSGRIIDPVSIPEFMESSQYLGLKGEIYPRVMEHLIEINSGQYDEIVLTGGIGSAKTSIALWSLAFQVYQLSLLLYPQQHYGLDHSSEILFVFQSLTGILSKEVDYHRFRELVHMSPYFSRIFPYDSDKESTLYFPRRIIVKPVSGEQTAAIGQNVFGGVIDEINYMQKVDKSRQSIDGGSYDQAKALYNSIARRRQSRFMQGGTIPGLLCLVSSKRYPGQFTDVKFEEAAKDRKEFGASRIYCYDKRTWEVVPEDRYTGEWFKLFLGDLTRQPRVLSDAEEVPVADEDLVMLVPIEYKRNFEVDIMDAIREIAGVSTLARHPYFVNNARVSEGFGTTKSILSRDRVNFDIEKLAFRKEYFVDLGNTGLHSRYCHVDLAITGDSAGLAIGYVRDFAIVDRGETAEMMPNIVYDCLLEIVPPNNGEIEFSMIRELLYDLRSAGLPIQWVSFDSYQSRDSLQVLRSQGFQTGLISLDKDNIGYDILKSAFNDGRISAPMHDVCIRELFSLEKDPATGKIDHPVGGSKDVSDAMAGVAVGLTTRREVWAHHGVPTYTVDAGVRGLGDAESYKPVEPPENLLESEYFIQNNK